MIKNRSFYKLTFKNSIFVIKISGKVLSNRDSLQNIAENIKILQDAGIKIIVICGFGIQLDFMVKQIYDKEPQKINGRRVTSAEDIECAKMCCGKIIADLSEIFSSCNISFASCFPITKDILNVVRRKGETFGLVGDIMNIHSNEIINILDDKMAFISTSIAISSDNCDILNINADTMASQIAIAIKAEKIVFISDVPYIKDQNGNRISIIKQNEIENLINSGIVTDGMLVKTENIQNAIRNGVSKIHIISGMEKDSLMNEILSESGIGTVVENDKSHNY